MGLRRRGAARVGGGHAERVHPPRGRRAPGNWKRPRIRVPQRNRPPALQAVRRRGGRGDRGAAGAPPRYIVYPANLWPHKNHVRLLEALRHVDQTVHLVLTGSGYGKVETLMSAAARLGVSSRVHHLGYVGANVLPVLYRRATALVFPSLYEGFGSPPLEAMACGCPAAVARSASLPEVCGSAALYFDPQSPRSMADALSSLLGDQALRRELRDAGLRHAPKFTWAASAQRHLTAYRAAAG